MARKPNQLTRITPTITAGESIGFALPRKTAAAKARAKRLFDALARQYPDARCELDANSPLQLLLATMLSAQCTDVAVNRVIPALFAAFPTAQHFARSTPGAIEPYIRSIGLFRAKAKALQASCALLVEEHGGEVPANMQQLLTLRGVARKTANVVLGNAFGINLGVVVDTHVERLAHRFGLSRATTATMIERDLMALFPREQWRILSHLLILHGRRSCKARGASCATDAICREFCTLAQSKSGAARGTTPSSSKSKRHRQKVAST